MIRRLQNYRPVMRHLIRRVETPQIERGKPVPLVDAVLYACYNIARRDAGYDDSGRFV